MQSILNRVVKLSACRALATLGQDPAGLSRILVRVALSSKTHSAVSALKALLAFSSVHRYGLQVQAGMLKIFALKALAAATGMFDSTSMEAVQHVAAGMLLYSLEVWGKRPFRSYRVGVASSDVARYNEPLALETIGPGIFGGLTRCYAPRFSLGRMMMIFPSLRTGFITTT